MGHQMAAHGQKIKTYIKTTFYVYNICNINYVLNV
jgi:hypothetical protein